MANNNISNKDAREIVEGNSYAKIAAAFINANQENDFSRINRELTTNQRKNYSTNVSDMVHKAIALKF